MSRFERDFAMLGIHLWKEWRECRWMLLWILIVTAVGSVVLGNVVVRFDMQSSEVPAFAMALACLIVVLSLGSELLGRELASGNPAAIARLPGGLLRPFAARLFVFVAAMVMAGALAHLVTAETHEFLTGKALKDKPLVGYAPLLALIGIVATWTLAASCWLRQPTLSTPAAGILAGLLLIAPLAIPVHGKYLYDLLRGDFVRLGGIAIGAGVLAACVSFIRGLRLGGGRVAAFLSGGVVLLIGLLPFHALGGWRVVEWFSLDPEADDLAIWEALVGTGGRYAFVSAGHRHEQRRPYHAFVVDLATGESRDLGSNRVFFPVSGSSAGTSSAGDHYVPQAMVRLVEADSYRFDTAIFVDGVNGEVIRDGSGIPQLESDASFEARLRSARREISPIRLDGDRRAWIHAGRVERDGADSGVELIGLAQSQFLWADTRGYATLDDLKVHEWSYVDLVTNRTISLRSSSSGWRGRFCEGFAVRAERRDGPWVLVGAGDPPPPAPGICDVDEFVAVTSLGRAVVYSPRDPATGPFDEQNPKNEVWLVDSSGAREPLHFEDGSPAIVHAVWNMRSPCGRTPAGSLVLSCWSGSTRARRALARLNESDRVLVRGGSHAPGFVASLDEESAIAITDDGAKLVRVRFGETEQEVLFPRSSARP